MVTLKLNKRPNFGFESENIFYHHSGESRRDFNLERLASCIPVIGSVFGILEFRQMSRDAQGKKRKIIIEKSGKVGTIRATMECPPESYNLKERKLRAAITTLSLGIIFLPYDVYITIKRKWKQIQLTNEQKKKIEEYRNSPDPEPTPAKLKELEAREKELQDRFKDTS